MNSIWKNLYYIVLLSLLFSCNGQNDSIKENVRESNYSTGELVDQGYIKFDTLVHNFGTLIDGEQVVCYFDYENSGESELIIESVESSCGCTVPDWSGKPLKPSERATVKVMFDTSGRQGEQMKVITIRSNASNSDVRLKIIANIIND